MMEKEASSSSESVLGQEGGAAEGSAPDWKEVVREMFEEGEGVGGLFRCVGWEAGGGCGRERDRETRAGCCWSCRGCGWVTTTAVC